MDPEDQREAIRQLGLQLGFARVGFAAPTRLPHGDLLADWIADGNAAAMRFMVDTWKLRDDPRQLLPEVASIIVCAARYADGERNAPPEHGRIARYARGPDYHVVLWQRLATLHTAIEGLVGHPLAARPVVDTAPLLERELAMAAGIGFIGKNTMLITPGIGSYTVLGALLLTDISLPPDPPARPRCGRCTLCLDACRASALSQPYQLDARRCVSYLTIEHRGRIEGRTMERCSDGAWVFGCDDCQQVCPYNHPNDGENDPELSRDATPSIYLPSLLRLRSGAYRRLTNGRALRRASAPTLRRNAAIAAGSCSSPSDELIEALQDCATNDRHETVREAALWARDRMPE